MEEGNNIAQLQSLIEEIKAAGRYDVLLKLVGVPALQHLNIEAAKQRLSRLVVTKDYRILLPDYNKEVELEPIHKALYILFLRHPEGIEFKRLQEHKAELITLYKCISNRTFTSRTESTIDRLVNPLDNSINEKCARIKAAFAQHMDSYQLSYYVISGHSVKHIDGSSRVWFERKKTINLPREMVTLENIRTVL